MRNLQALKKSHKTLGLAAWTSRMKVIENFCYFIVRFDYAYDYRVWGCFVFFH